MHCCCSPTMSKLAKAQRDTWRLPAPLSLTPPPSSPQVLSLLRSHGLVSSLSCPWSRKKQNEWRAEFLGSPPPAHLAWPTWAKLRGGGGESVALSCKMRRGGGRRAGVGMEWERHCGRLASGSGLLMSDHPASFSPCLSFMELVGARFGHWLLRRAVPRALLS